VVQTRYSRTANFVREGAPILTLREKTSNPYVTASIPQDQALRFYKGASAVIEYADGTRVREANIERLPSFEDPSLAGRMIVKLAPGRELGASTIGQPVSVVFNTFSGSSMGSAVSKLQTAFHWAGNKIASILAKDSATANAPKKATEPQSENGRRLAGLSSGE
jgi:alginate biosynthesis protein Alg44